ncbi:MAG: phage holin family protein [Thermoflexibacteraceae bacterium]
MINFILRILLMAAVILIGANFIPGVSVKDYKTALIATVVLGLLNTFVKPVVKLFALPITILTLGLFLIVINVLMVFVAAYFVDGFAINGLISGLVFSVVISVASFILSKILDND